MLFPSALLLFIITSCLSTPSHKQITPKKDKPAIEAIPEHIKVDPQHLSVSLDIEASPNKGLNLAIFSPNLDPKASYLQYQACQADNPLRCVKSTMTGLMKEPRSFYPLTGKLIISYQACIDPRRSKTKEKCSLPRETSFEQAPYQDLETSKLYMAQLEITRSIQEKSVDIQKAVKEYVSNTAHDQGPKDFQTMVQNLYHMNSNVLGEILSSDGFDVHRKSLEVLWQKKLETLDSESASQLKMGGVSLLILGSQELSHRLSQKDQKESIQDMNYALDAVVSQLLTNPTLGTEQQTFKVLFSKLAKIEGQILDLKNQKLDYDTRIRARKG